jgi:hypothetical protein
MEISDSIRFIVEMNEIKPDSDSLRRELPFVIPKPLDAAGNRYPAVPAGD